MTATTTTTPPAQPPAALPATTVFELHRLPLTGESAADASTLPWSRGRPTAAPPPVEVPADGQPVWLARGAAPGEWAVVPEASAALAGFRVVAGQHRLDLALLTGHPEVLVNGRRALALTILAVKDSVVLDSHLHLFVTQRVRPYHGPAPAALVGKICPFCRLAFTAESTLVMCRCGTAYHREPLPPEAATGAGSADEAESDVLRCFDKVQKCLSCSRDLTLKEYLEWNPRSAW